MQIFDQLAGTKSHAGMLEIRFRAGTKIIYLPVSYWSFCTDKSIFLIRLPVQNFMPVCLKSGSVPVPKHFGCRYIIFHFVQANKFFWTACRYKMSCRYVWNPVPCRYKNTLVAGILFFHCVLANANLWFTGTKKSNCTGKRSGIFMMGKREGGLLIRLFLNEYTTLFRSLLYHHHSL